MKIQKINEFYGDTLVNNTKNYRDNQNYDFYVDMFRYLDFIFDNLAKLSGTPVLIKGLSLNGEIPYTHDTVGEMFSIGHITGLAVEEAIVKCISTYINGYEGEEDDIADVINTIGRQGLDIQDNIRLSFGRDNMPKQDFYMSYLGKTYSIQLKAVQSKNEGTREMNAAIRNGVDLGIVVVYDIVNSDVIVKTIQLYVPDVDGTYNYISTRRLGKKKLSLDRNKSFITIGNRI